jgi:hypothetical protein
MSLKVRNNTPSEAIEAPGRFVVPYEYTDSRGNIAVGASNEVALAERIASGPESTTQYSFTFTNAIPAAAQDIKYWLVFRGKLGNEDDAVAAYSEAAGGIYVAYYVWNNDLQQYGYVIADRSLNPIRILQPGELDVIFPTDGVNYQGSADPIVDNSVYSPLQQVLLVHCTGGVISPKDYYGYVGTSGKAGSDYSDYIQDMSRTYTVGPANHVFPYSTTTGYGTMAYTETGCCITGNIPSEAGIIQHHTQEEWATATYNSPYQGIYQYAPTGSELYLVYDYKFDDHRILHSMSDGCFNWVVGRQNISASGPYYIPSPYGGYEELIVDQVQGDTFSIGIDGEIVIDVSQDSRVYSGGTTVVTGDIYDLYGPGTFAIYNHTAKFVEGTGDPVHIDDVVVASARAVDYNNRSVPTRVTYAVKWQDTGEVHTKVYAPNDQILGCDQTGKAVLLRLK